MKSKQLFIIIGVLAVVALVIIFFSGSSDSPQVAPSGNGDDKAEELAEASSFVVKDSSGKEFSISAYQAHDGQIVSLTEFAGKPLVINSWAGWCPFCKKELKDFVTVQKEAGDDVVFIVINRAESLSTARDAIADYKIVEDDLVFLLDPKDSFYQSIGGFSMPETIFVDREGVIQIHKRGPMDEKEIREKLDLII